MAVCMEDLHGQLTELQQDEVEVLKSIYENEFSLLNDSKPVVFELTIDVKLSCDNVTIEAFERYENPKNVVPVPENGANLPVFNRSESGKRLRTEFQLQYLTPITLHVTLRDSYPENEPPIFSLSCLWLSSNQLSCLCRQLDALWVENENQPIIFIWMDWFLGITNRILLSEFDPVLEGEGRDPRALPECANLRNGLCQLIQFDLAQENAAFCKSLQTCNICYCDVMGTECLRLLQCGHHFCKDCTYSMCSMHVAQGSVQLLQCPEKGCDTALPPHVLRDTLGDEMFRRWERLLLQQCLDKMADVVWCPRDNHAVVKDADQPLAQCPVCHFTFCTLCRESWHQGSPCLTLEDKVENLEAKMQSNAADAKAVAREMLRLKQELLGEAYSRKNSKACPSCGMRIQKAMGCNKVTCSVCGAHMCWACGKKIAGYDHFNDKKCMLSDATANDGELWFEPRRRYLPPPVPDAALRARVYAENTAGDAQHLLLRCKVCRQRNIKEDRNNHIRCWQCKSNLCFQCKDTISGVVSRHFNAADGCRQHSDDT